MIPRFFLFALGLAMTAASLFAGTGSIVFGNRHIDRSDLTGTYHVPIWIDQNGDEIRQDEEGVGTVAAAMGTTAALGLFLPGQTEPLVTSVFRSDLNGAFLASSSQTAYVTGHVAGATVVLEAKAWVGPSYETALIRGSWTFTSKPLGGEPPDGGLPVLPPTMTGWGPESGFGFALVSGVTGPNTGRDQIIRRTGENGAISVATLLANDSDPTGSAVTFVTVFDKSAAGASVTVVGDQITYHTIGATTDSFIYLVRNNAGGVSRGTVEVIVNDPDGFIIFSPRAVPKAAGEGTYDVPVFVDANFDGARDATEGLGAFASTFYGKTATLGLFLRGASTPLATATFATDSSEGAFTLGAQRISIPPLPPGTSAELTVKAWIGSDYDSAPLKGAWDFVSRPLGGTIMGIATHATPGLTGWGGEGGSGLTLEPGPKPLVVADEFTRRYRRDLTIEVSALLANDSDPEGGALSFIGVDERSNGNAPISVSGTTITYRHTSDGADFFNYTVRTAHGVVGKGRVDVKVTAPEGEIRLANRSVLSTNGVSRYDVPIWVDMNFNGTREANEGFGTFIHNFLRQTATLGIFVTGNIEPIAIAQLATDSTGAFVSPGNETNVLAAGTSPGQTVPLTIKVWDGASYDTARFKRSWDIVSAPLGGPGADGAEIPTPGLTGWGNENGDGFVFTLGERPTIGADLIVHPTDQVGTITIPVILSNDVDPNGGVLTLLYIDPLSARGISITVDGSLIVYSSTSTTDDYFNYTVQLSNGGIATGRVDVVANDSDGAIYFSNRLVRRSSGAGAYNIPFWVDKDFNGRRDKGEGIGDFAAEQFGTNATLALFVRDGTIPLATATFQTGHAAAFLGAPEFQTVKIPGGAPGSTAALTVKAWVGSSFTSATIKGSWDFTSLPLGGSKAGLGVFATPDISGLGNEETGEGLKIVPGAKPVTYGRVLTRNVGQNVNALLATLTGNDSDPEGGALSLVSVDETSANGAVITVLGNTLYYIRPIADTDSPDLFEYTVRNAKGGIARGRVDVVVTDGAGVFKTRLAIENTASGARISFRGVIGTSYAVESRASLDEPWQSIGPAAALGFGMFEVTDPAGAATKFYRVLAQP